MCPFVYLFDLPAYSLPFVLLFLLFQPYHSWRVTTSFSFLFSSFLGGNWKHKQRIKHNRWSTRGKLTLVIRYRHSNKDLFRRTHFGSLSLARVFHAIFGQAYSRIWIKLSKNVRASIDFWKRRGMQGSNAGDTTNVSCIYYKGKIFVPFRYNEKNRYRNQTER